MTTTQDTDDLDILIPGIPVPVLDGRATVRVFPLGLKHMKKWTRAIVQTLDFMINQIQLTKKDLQDKEKLGGALVGQLAPYIMINLLDLMQDCVTVEGDRFALEDLPHYDVAAVIDTWIEESFGDEKKWRPWLQMTEKLITKATGKQISLLDMLSKFSSKEDTAS